MKNLNLLNLKSIVRSKARWLLTLIAILTLGVGQMWGGATWIGKSFIVANGTWYNGSGSGQTYNFHNKNIGTITSLTLGGEIQTYNQSDGKGNPARMHYKIDNGTSTYITLYWFKYESNNNFFHSASGNEEDFSSTTIDISGLSAGDHTISVWFEQPDGSQWDSNNSSNYVATFRIDPVVTFKANGGSGSDYTQRVTYNTSTALTACTFTRSGYAFAGWATSSDGSVVYADAASATLTSHTTLFAKWTPEETHNVTVYYKCGAMTIANSTTESGVGVTTTRSVSAPAINDHTFSSWTAGTGVKTNSSTSATPISINSKGSGTYSLTANYTLVTCSLSVGTSATYTEPGTKYLMSYDADEDAYYYDMASSPANLYFRFCHATDSKIWSGNWNTYPNVFNVDANGSKIDCGTNVKDWGEKASLHFSGLTGSPIRIWFDFQNKKAWITEATYTVSISSENTNKGTVSTSSVTAGKNTVSSSFSATAKDGYRFKQWSATTATLQSTNTTNPNTVKTTAAGSVQAKFDYRWVLRGSINSSDDQHGMPGWSTETDYFTGISAGGKTGTITVTLEAKTKYKFKVYDLVSGSYYSKASTDWSGSNNINTSKDVTEAITFTTTAPGPYTFTFNFDSKNIAIAYPTTHTVTYGYGNGGSGVTAKVSSVSIGSSPGYAISGTDVVLTASNATGYHFVEWRTASGGGGSQISTSNPYTISSINENKTIYAVFAADNYTTANNLKDAGGNAGQYNVNYDATSIAHTSAPSRSGYTVEGYYKQAAWTNKIANTNLSLVASTDYTTAQNKWKVTSAPDLYIKWQQTLTLAKNTTAEGSTNGGITLTYNSKAVSGYTRASRTGYTLNGYYTATSGGYKVINADGTLVSYSSNVSSYLKNSTGEWIYSGTPTLSAQWSVNTYTVTLDPGWGGSGSGTMTVDYDETAYNTWSHTITQNYYHIEGWFDGETKVLNPDGSFAADNVTGYITDGKWSKASDCTLYAHWAGNTYSVSFNANGGTGSLANQTGFTYNVSKNLTSIGSSIYRDGYHFDGWATASDGDVVLTDGAAATTQLAPASSGVTIPLYAKWTQVALTDLTFSPNSAAGETSVTITPVLSATPTGTSSICWGLYYDYACTSAVEGISFFANPSAGSNTVTFTTPEASGTYYVKADYRTGNSCGGGTLLTSYKESYVVASDHTVNIRYMCGSTEIASRSNVEIPAAGTVLVQPRTDIFGYTFSSWTAGDGVTITDPTDEEKEAAGMADVDNVKKVSAVYNGTLTANYTRDNIIYFKNTLGWTDVYVNLYPNTWWGARGAGNQSLADDKRNKQMTRLGETDVWYYNYGGTATTAYVSFTDQSQNNYEYFAGADKDHRVRVIYPTKPDAAGSESTDYGFNSGTPMFVPLADQTGQKWNGDTGNELAEYFNKGYWREYEPATGNTGYTLIIYNKVNSDGRWAMYSLPMTDATGADIFEATIDLEAGTTYGVKFLRNNSMYYTANGSTLSKNGGYTAFSKQAENWAACGIETTVAGDYIFRLTCGNDGQLKMAVSYPAADGDYRLLYKDNIKTGWHPSDVIRKVNNGTEIVSFFVRKAQTPQIQIQTCAVDDENDGDVTWSDSGEAINPATTYSSDITKDGVYNFYLSMDGSGALSIDSVKPYKGDYYIRTDAVGGTKWADFRNASHKMTYSDYAASNEGFTHYFVNWVTQNSNVKFTVANEYSSCVTDTLVGDPAGSVVATIDGGGEMTSANANVRFMYNETDNTLRRAYLAGAQDNGSYFLVLQGEAGKLLTSGGEALVSGNNGGVDNNAIQLTDNQEWLYKTTVKAEPGGKVKLYAKYNSVAQYFIGKSPLSDWTTADAYEELIGGEGDAQNISVVYDFKTGRMIAAWEPADEINSALTVNADVMIVRNHQESSKNIIFANDNNSLTTEKTIYGVMRFNRYVLDNRSTTGGHGLLPIGEWLSTKERFHYYISFPFDVNVSDIFGFGTYGVHWVLQRYDGKARAKNGLWADEGMTYWKYVAPNGKLNAYEGYLLALSPSQMAYSRTGEGEVWHNGREEVELYFPNADKGATIGVTDAINIPAPSSDYICTINRGDGTAGDRRIADSYWRCIGVPSFADYTTVLGNGAGGNVAWAKPAEYESGDIHFLYQIQWTDYSVKPVSGSTFGFQAMHAYMTQISTAIVWNHVNSITNSIVAKHRSADEISNQEFRLTINQNEEEIDQTFIRLSDDEQVTNGFEFGHDMSKEFNSAKPQIYTFIGYEKVAANSMPISTQTTVVPVGLKIAEDGEYTFSMPDGTEGIGVTLIDTETSIRTNLSALDYTVVLEAGEYNNRFIIEISPVSQVATDIESLNGEHGESGARKMMIDGILYIVKDGKIFDARGSRVE